MLSAAQPRSALALPAHYVCVVLHLLVDPIFNLMPKFKLGVFAKSVEGNLEKDKEERDESTLVWGGVKRLRKLAIDQNIVADETASKRFIDGCALEGQLWCRKL